MSPPFSSREAIATAMRAERPEMTMPGTCMRPRQAKKATVAAVATVRLARTSMRFLRLDTVARPKLIAARMHPLIDTRDAGMVNAFIASVSFEQGSGKNTKTAADTVAQNSQYSLVAELINEFGIDSRYGCSVCLQSMPRGHAPAMDGQGIKKARTYVRQ